MNRPSVLIACAVALGLASGCGPDRSSSGSSLDRAVGTIPTPARSAPDFDRDVAPVLARHCRPCHLGEEAEGGLDLAPLLDREASHRRGETWDRVFDLVRSGSMPPPGRSRPSGPEVAAMAAWVDAEVSEAGPRSRGRAVLRRLNRAEYDNTIRDLIGLDLRPAEDFPADDVGHGFDNNGEVLAIPPVLMERYLSAAERVVDAAFRSESARRRILEPGADPISFRDRGYRPPVRSQPRKRVGAPTAPDWAPPDPIRVREARLFDIFRGFADRAFRRPATAEELARLVALAESALAEGEDFEGAVKLGLRAVLASPHFLYLVESDPEPTIHPVSEFELAARLSYFLWSSLPDDELSRLAASGRLRLGDELDRQVRRMLRDDRASAIASNFGGQWLQTRRLRDFEPDPRLFPGVDRALLGSMAREVELFLGALIREDHAISEILSADFTFVDARLASQYGIAGVVGPEFRRVSTAGTPRGGILTMAGVLSLTSNPTRTSPVKRGRWVLETILGIPILPAPPGLGDLGESSASGSETLRERLERHRSDLACASCHARMDPIGFGLENFDAVGAWRSTEGGRPIDSSGELPGGETFRGPDELRAVIIGRMDDFRRCLAEKFLTYALGRGLTRGDRRAVGEIVRRTSAGGDRFSSLILGIVGSDPFQERDGRDLPQ